jgi:hypothetical protein
MIENLFLGVPPTPFRLPASLFELRRDKTEDRQVSDFRAYAGDLIRFVLVLVLVLGFVNQNFVEYEDDWGSTMTRT